MKPKLFLVLGLGAVACAVPAVIALAGTNDRQNPSTGLVREVRQATRDFLDVNAAMGAGYGSTGSCVSGPEEGAMGVHYVNGSLISNDELVADKPEILVYEPRNGRLRLLAVEYVVDAAAWDAKKIGPPVLMGQHFHLVGGPNRYGPAPFYELHVWAWKNNPSGMFADWNPTVSCEEYAGESTALTASGHAGHH